MVKFLSWAWTLFWLIASGVFGIAFYGSYWRWRDCFNEEGRCWTGEVVHDAQSVFLAVPLALCVIAALSGIVVILRVKRRVR